MVPIPQGSSTAEPFIGSPAAPDPVSMPRVPRNPFMAPNGRSNIHDDAYQTDTYRWGGPLGQDIGTSSAFFGRECASITFDSKGRLVTICVGADHPVLALLNPQTLEPLATMDLPPRNASPNPFQDFSGGGYFYLDNHDRAVIPTASTRQILVVAETRVAGEPAFEVKHAYDVSSAVGPNDSMISVLPDWHGRLWFATKKGIVGTVARRGGKVRAKDMGEPIGNSFAVDENGGVYIVTDAALYRFGTRRGGKPKVIWRRTYPNIGVVKPGQTQKGSGTTPTLMGHDYVAITDNADPMHVVVYRRARHVNGKRVLCREPVFDMGSSSTDQSLVGANRNLIAENNYGYTGPSATEDGKSTAPGLTRVSIRGGCHTVWESDERAPSVVPKLSLRNGLVYTYTKPPRDDGEDNWYFTALDYQTGETVYQRFSGEGLGYNNNYAPVTLARTGTAYVGVLGGITRFEDSP